MLTRHLAHAPIASTRALNHGINRLVRLRSTLPKPSVPPCRGRHSRWRSGVLGNPVPSSVPRHGSARLLLAPALGAFQPHRKYQKAYRGRCYLSLDLLGVSPSRRASLLVFRGNDGAQPYTRPEEVQHFRITGPVHDHVVAPQRNLSTATG
jgi:hypothetical protein